MTAVRRRAARRNRPRVRPPLASLSALSTSRPVHQIVVTVLQHRASYEKSSGKRRRPASSSPTRDAAPRISRFQSSGKACRRRTGRRSRLSTTTSLRSSTISTSGRTANELTGDHGAIPGDLAGRDQWAAPSTYSSARPNHHRHRVGQAPHPWPMGGDRLTKPRPDLFLVASGRQASPTSQGLEREIDILADPSSLPSSCRSGPEDALARRGRPRL